MSERLSELSASVSLELRTRMQDSRDRILASQKIISSMHKEPVIVNGTKAVLEQISSKLEEIDELHIAAMQQINETYGTPSVGEDGNDG